MDGQETERGLDLSPDTEILVERTVPQGQLLQVLILRRRESGHIAGDGTEGIEQGCLHSGFEEQQVHVNLLGVAEVPPEEVVHPAGCLLWVAGHSLDINFEVPF